jgi:pSer/pThr/pTyr-binding forkhead associated (FHA) protein
MARFESESFAASCLAQEPLALEVVPLGDEREAFTTILPLPFALIGRDARSDVFLDHDDVSRRHAYFQVITGRVFFVDLGSRTGIRRGGIPAASGWLARGEAVEIGPYRVRLHQRGAARDRPHPGPAMDPDPLTEGTTPGSRNRTVALEFPTRSGGTKTFEVRRCLSLLGRAKCCSPRLPDESLSWFHCGLLRTLAGVWVVDLLGRGGVKVGGAVVRFARVDDGDEIRLGKYVFHLRQEAQDEDATNPWSESLAGPSGWVPPTLPTLLAGREQGGASNVPATPWPTGRVASVWPRDRTEFAETPLAALIQQFGEMQQSMFDQFQQTMLMILQMFGSMHRDQMGEIREALAQIRDLSEQLRTLQSDSNRPGSEPASVVGIVGQRPEPESTASRPRDVSSVGSAPQQRRLLGGLKPEEHNGETPDGVTNSPRDVPSGNEGDAPVAASVAGTRGGKGSAQSEEEFHILLCRKIAAIQEEKQTRWEKIMNIIKGM